MGAQREEIANLERLNYMAMRPMIEVTPGVELILRDDVIITSSQVFPTPDANHACLLQATDQTVSSLIAEIIEHFSTRELPPTVFVSPACTPENLPDLLSAHGFVRQKLREAWMVLERPDDLLKPKMPDKVTVHSIAPDEAPVFAEVFLQAFGMPEDYAPALAEVLTPSIGLPGIFHYLATFNKQPLGVCTLICYQDLAIVGSAGVIGGHRGLKVLSGLITAIYADAYAQGCRRALLQTTADAPFERFLRIAGFKQYFSRTSYTLA